MHLVDLIMVISMELKMEFNKKLVIGIAIAVVVTLIEVVVQRQHTNNKTIKK